MRFKSPLIPAVLERRYKRFFADVRLEDGRPMTVHVPNTGAMLGLTEPGLRVWLSQADNPNRKLSHTLELVEARTGMAGVNTHLPNRLVEEAIIGGVIPELAGYPTLRREVRYDDGSRIDLLLEAEGRLPAYVEVKNVHLARTSGLAEFPDCRTERGLKHLGALERVVEAGGRAVMVFAIQQAGINAFDTADDLDAAYGPALRRAAERGVEVLCYAAQLSPEEIVLKRRVPWRALET
ncbi:DNA/RNA nuclease SfsA [Brevundimonas sp. 2R-24]|uniref:Sugar fermentation stimulation protein homolog n=1 Tax=Peiella sedimenti TaxID=3061083 RepID=A0ABT8SPR1_9CAUL|nr:DNA/RNA nuclease SfsA [Caulobacteraceae bacterium XZ-24]